jgi:hypothetical protein
MLPDCLSQPLLNYRTKLLAYLYWLFKSEWLGFRTPDRGLLVWTEQLTEVSVISLRQANGVIHEAAAYRVVG